MDYDTNQLKKEVNAVQKDITAKKKVHLPSSLLSLGKAHAFRAVVMLGQATRRRPRREEEGD